MEYDASALLRIAGDVYVSKIMADRVLIEADCSRERLADHMWSFAYFKLGSRYFTELVLQVTHYDVYLWQKSVFETYLATCCFQMD